MPNPITLNGIRRGKRILVPTHTASGPRGGTMPSQQSKHPEIMANLKNFMVSRWPDFNPNHILELETGTVIDQAKAHMETLGFASLQEVGNIELRANLRIDQPGVVAPAPFINKLVAPLAEAASSGGGSTVTIPATSPRLRRTSAAAVGGFFTGKRNVGTALNHGDLLAAIGDHLQDEAVIIADELNLTDRTLTINSDRVTHLWIIARSLKANAGSMINYTPTASPVIGGRGQNGTPPVAAVSFDPNKRQDRSGHHAANGGPGNPGLDGQTPPVAKDGPSLTICVLQIDSMPDIDLPGQRGGTGGTGGTGARGGHGQRGRDSKSVVCYCDHGPGYGGNGGRGGDGGRGGRGGNGGNGGTVTIATVEEAITSLVTSRQFMIDVAGGAGGPAGSQGIPGEGGQGGRPGHRTAFPCREEPDRGGKPGAQGGLLGNLGEGDPGADGALAFEIITRNEWLEKLESPWVMALEPTRAAPGNTVQIRGINFVTGTKVILRGRTVAANLIDNQTLSFQVPDITDGGTNTLQVRTPDGDLSNEMPLVVSPRITGVQVDGADTTAVHAGAEVALIGLAFVAGAGVESNGQVMETISVTRTAIRFRIPEGPGLDAGQRLDLVVVNPDGSRSNLIGVQRLPSRDSGFRSKQNGYAFANFSKGEGTWGTFIETFGELEIGGELLLNPILTGAFYLFFREFLKGSGGGAHCSGISATALESYHKGQGGLFSQYQVSFDDPPPLTNGLMRKLDIAQGRVLSKELILHYSDQSDEGIDRVEKTIRDIEQDIDDGLGLETARVMTFIHSGHVWDIALDDDVREAFLRAHCLVPTRITYPDANLGLDGARLYVYDCNHPGSDDKFLELFKKNNKIHFRYQPDPNAAEVSSACGFTLGTAKLPRQLLNDVDLPFSGLGGAGAFIVDLILSPARISIDGGSGRMLGLHGGKIHSDAELGHVHPWHDGLILIRDDAEVSRTIVGTGNGTYTYASIHPSGKSLTITDAACTPATKDVVTLKNDFSHVTVTSSDKKAMNLHLASTLSDGTVHYLAVGMDVDKNETIDLALQDNLDGVNVKTPGRDLEVVLNTKVFSGVNLVEEKSQVVRVPAAKSMTLERGFWSNIPHFVPTFN